MTEAADIELTVRASSNVRATGYDAETQVLVVEFNDGALYRYDHVPQEVATGLEEATSVGKYLHRSVFGLYPSTKMRRQ